MKFMAESKVKKLGVFARVLASFILLCSLIGAGGLAFSIVFEPFHPSAIAGVFVISLMLHISGRITFKGFAPRYLLFTHGPK